MHLSGGNDDHGGDGDGCAHAGGVGGEGGQLVTLGSAKRAGDKYNFGGQFDRGPCMSCSTTEVGWSIPFYIDSSAPCLTAS